MYLCVLLWWGVRVCVCCYGGACVCLWCYGGVCVCLQRGQGGGLCGTHIERLAAPVSASICSTFFVHFLRHA